MRVAAPAGVPLAQAADRFWAGYMALTGDGAVSGSSTRASATCTASGTAHTKGAWTQIIAATDNVVDMLDVSLSADSAASNTNTSTLLDIGIGAASSEVVIVPNLAVGWQAGDYSHHLVPVQIQKGSRVAIRCQSAVTSKTISARLHTYRLPHGCVAPTSIVDMGTDTGNSRGVVVTAPALANTKGAWTEIISATAEHFTGLIVGIQGGGDTTMQNVNNLLDIGIGPALGELVLIPDIQYVTAASEHMRIMCPNLFGCNVPKGSRLLARWATSGTGSALDVILYGVRKSL